MKSIGLAALTATAVLISACSGAGIAQNATPGTAAAPARAASLSQPAAAKLPPVLAARIEVPASIDPAESASAAYCTQTGGAVIVRRAVYGTNGSQPLPLAGVKDFCQYTNPSDGSRIHILLSTLYTTKPTLAALAYINKPPLGSCNGNPASCYCSFLGGSDQFGGTTGAGGGWYNKKAVDQVLEACIFPDMSSIDSWGLAYHSDGIIRGIDLTTVMRYKYPSH